MNEDIKNKLNELRDDIHLKSIVYVNKIKRKKVYERRVHKDMEPHLKEK